MSAKDHAVQLIVAAFEHNAYPGDDYLLGSRQGCEPADEVLPFQGKRDWRGISSEFLDQHGGALHFFTEAGLRFFLPAFLLADLRGELQYAEPLFTITSGFFDVQVEVEKNHRKFVIKSGRSHLMNPRLYGATTFHDFALHRLSIFTREEAVAIVAYLEYQRDADDCERPRIDDALNVFWRERAQSAPRASDLADFLREQQDFVDATLAEQRDKTQQS
jgi:hypothetical protein